MALSQTLLNNVELALHELNCNRYERDDQNGIFSFTLDTQTTEIPNLEFFMSVNENYLQIFGLLPLLVDVNNLTTVCRVIEFLKIVNADINFKKFTYVPYNGAIELKHSPYAIAQAQTKKTYPLIMGKLLSVRETVKTYAPGLLAVVSQGETPREAFAKCRL
ncbi:MAG: hypothetical protein Q4G03_06960 [Planctomycetia bacterium]|nr:hypothetical protein [Planctomycetia bacterium]